MFYGIITREEISPFYIGLVIEIIDLKGKYFEIGNCGSPSQFIHIDCVTSIDKETYDFLLSRNDVIKKWIEERDK